jgi:D-3-phosphoglycerate dehydrogenase
MSTATKILIAAPVHPVLKEGLEAMGYQCLIHEKITLVQAYEIMADCVGVITSTRLLLDKALIDAAPKLQWIGRMGSGMEIVDVAYAQQRGVWCFSSPEGNRNAVGEHAMGLLLALIRKIVTSNNEIKNNIWLRDENRGTELEGKTVGIIGYGHTGRALARKLTGFDVNICAYDPYAPYEEGDTVRCGSLAELMSSADVVSFHVPLNADTRHYCNDSFINGMAKPFILVNTSRGPVVATKALHRGLTEGKVLGACLDVFEHEPVSTFPAEDRHLIDDIIGMPNVVATPHIAGYTHEALYKMSRTLLDKLQSR